MDEFTQIAERAMKLARERGVVDDSLSPPTGDDPTLSAEEYCRGASKSMVDAACGDLQATALMKKTQQFMKGNTNTLLLVGPPGVGKSTCACFYLIQKQNKKSIFVKCHKFSKEYVNKYIYAPYLVIDDLGMEPRSESFLFADWFKNVIMERYDLKLKTIITTVLRLEELDRKYGESVFSRLLDGDLGMSEGPVFR